MTTDATAAELTRLAIDATTRLAFAIESINATFNKYIDAQNPQAPIDQYGIMTDLVNQLEQLSCNGDDTVREIRGAILQQLRHLADERDPSGMLELINATRPMFTGAMKPLLERMKPLLERMERVLKRAGAHEPPGEPAHATDDPICAPFWTIHQLRAMRDDMPMPPLARADTPVIRGVDGVEEDDDFKDVD